MAGFSRLVNYSKTNPVALYIGGGVLLHLVRSFAVNAAYTQHFSAYDVERKRELESHLASHKSDQ
jgi:hypothetical protein